MFRAEKGQFHLSPFFGIRASLRTAAHGVIPRFYDICSPDCKGKINSAKVIIIPSLDQENYNKCLSQSHGFKDKGKIG
jgi:hypothetical protein